jgi:S-disulfanyl-L-cysteine oxidoreductase SoxD
MFNCREVALALIVLATGAAQAQAGAYVGVGRPATAKEIAAWDIDVRPDFKGLPKGAGSVAKGMEVWESKCASCHGVFGESNEVFSPIVGGTTAQDIKTGRVARLNDASFPGRTTLMKLSSVSTLWDYINRAMPWTAPKSLKPDEVYAVTAYLLNLGEVVPADFVLSDQNIAEVQQRLPNRNGMTTEHALWPGAGLGSRPADVKAAACMKDCGPPPIVASFLPDFARDAHGNLAEQNRTVGAQRGADTSRPPAAVAQAGPAAAPPAAAAAIALAQKHSCVACHGMDSKLLGPSFREVAKKHAGRADDVAYLAGKIKSGGSGVWGGIPMPAQTLGDAEAEVIAQWLVDGAKK